MELGALTYFSSNLFWFATSLSFVVMFVAGWKYTGSSGGKIGQNINFSNTYNKMLLALVFVVSQVVLNLLLVAGSSLM